MKARRPLAICFAAMLAAGAIFLPAAAAALPSGFTDTRLVGGLNLPTAMEFAPDGRLFVAEKTGALKVVKNGALLATPFVTVSEDSYGERGLLGIAFHPNFSSNRYVYLYYTTSSSPIHNVVSRFTADPANPDRALAGSEVVILNLESTGNGFHNGGAIHFGPDGKLYVAVGDHGSSSNSQSLSTRQGKMLRINSDGTIPSDNPFYNTIGAKKEIWALGLRNPFTFAFSSSSTGAMYINDVGQDSWEEINVGRAGANYGWPVCEGTCSNSNFVNPLYTYSHPSGSGRSIAGGAFYDAAQFPSEYRGGYFFGDYVAGFIKRLTPSKQAMDFIANASSPVDIKVGPDGSLYYLLIGTGEVRKVMYSSAGNGAPNAVASGNPTSGPAPLTVNFSGSGSSDPNGDPLTYSWNYGDGSSGSGSSVAHTYSSAGPYTATLTVSDGRGGSDTATVDIAAGTPPAATINTPSAGTKYNAGNTISFSGSATDAQDGNNMPASAFRWVVLFHHNTHTHPFQEFSGVKSGTFTIPTTGETDSDVWYRIYLTVTDSSGLTNTATRDVTPNKASLTLASNVQGLQLNLDGQPKTTPYSFTGVVGMSRTLQAPSTQTLNGQAYQFQSWSDGGQATHTISTPATGATYTANYAPGSPGQYELTISSADMQGNPIAGYYTTIQSSGGSTVKTGFTPLSYTGSAGTYAVTVHDYGGATFDHWDNDSASRTRTVAVNSDAELTAYYVTPSSSTTRTLTVATQDEGGNALSGYWTVLYDGSGGAVASGFSPETFTLDSGQQYSVSVGDYGAYSFDRWADNGSTANPRDVSITANTQLTAVYGTTSPSSTYPVTHMSDTTLTFGSLTYSGRQVNAEYAGASSQLVGDRIDSITLGLQRIGSPAGTAEVGVFNDDLSVKKLFGTVNVGALSASYADHEFKLAGGELYTIQSGDRIGIKFAGGGSGSGVNVMIDRDEADPFDGTSSQRVRYEAGSWRYYDTNEDLYMTLKQTHG